MLVGAVAEQQPDDVGVALTSGAINGRPAALAGYIEVSGQCDERGSGEIEVVIPGGGVEWRCSILIIIVGVGELGGLATYKA
jgi:hypothetical protein